MMQTLTLGNSDVLSSRLIYGCMRLAGDNSPEARERGKAAIHAALEAGYTHFDHADIYGGGQCEDLFGEVLRESPGLRERVFITSKCGIRGHDSPEPGAPARYDFYREYIMASVHGILERLGIEQLDMLLLHRPDYLGDADEVAATFSHLQEAGRVAHFGVSNFRPSTLSLYAQRCPMPLLVNQVEINIHNISALLDGTLDLCVEKGVTPQAWCPLGGVAYPAWGNTFTPEDEKRIRVEFARQAKKYDVADWQIMLAWILKHPSGICPIIGSTKPERIKASTIALEIPYTREDWYRLLEARNGHRVP